MGALALHSSDESNFVMDPTIETDDTYPNLYTKKIL